MPWDFPVEVNCYEAFAYCRWLSQQLGVPVTLPSEEEYYALLKHIGYDHEKAKSNIGLRYSNPSPIDKFETNGLYDAMGNIWQWTRTPMYPFKGFEVHQVYDDFTMPTFDDKHNLMKGGSWVSTGNLAMPFSRYAFRRHFYQHAGFRTAFPSLTEE